MNRSSLKTQLIIGFIVIMLPVVTFLVVNNVYAKNVVRDKISETYQNTLDIFVRQTDRSMAEIDEYLHKMAVLDTDVGMLMSFPYGSDHYILTKVRIQNKINRDIGFYNLIDSIFLFNEHDIFFNTSGHYPAMIHVLGRHLYPNITLEHPEVLNEWIFLKDDQVPGNDFMMKISEVTDGMYVGATIKIADIHSLLSIQWDDGDIGEGVIYRRDGTKLAESLSNATIVPLEDVYLLDQPYQTIVNDHDGERYLVMNRMSSVADLAYSIIVPENYILQKLPYFQKATYTMAFGIIFIFFLYLLFIRQMVFNPMQNLIVGMKKLSLGMLDIRLSTAKTIEFAFLANTFNNMADQIKKLKIGMYEEQLRAQKIEMRQLQAQINPHFYMNSLNIIYNFAALKDHDSVKKMSLYLGDYFRFIMQMNRDVISLQDELRHIDNYMKIQQFRFLNLLTYQIDVPEAMKSIQIPALSIQPFVENAIIHGFVDRKKMFSILVSGRQIVEEATHHVEIIIQDNGAGFSEELLHLLNANKPLPQAETSRLGIFNVLQRLRLHYGDEASVTFANHLQEGGAIVRLQLPIEIEFHADEKEEFIHV